MLRCKTCDEPISEDRIKAILTTTGNLPDTCTIHSNVVRPIGFMVSASDDAQGGKVYGKTGQVLLAIDPRNKEVLRKAIRCHRRAR
jgi:hypothetical protein